MYNFLSSIVIRFFIFATRNYGPAGAGPSDQKLIWAAAWAAGAARWAAPDAPAVSADGEAAGAAAARWAALGALAVSAGAEAAEDAEAAGAAAAR